MLLALINITSLVYCESTRARIWERPRINGRWNSAQEIMSHDFPLIWLTLHALKAWAQHTSHCRYILLVVHCKIKLCTKVCTCLQASHNNKRRLAMRTACAGAARTVCADAARWLRNIYTSCLSCTARIKCPLIMHLPASIAQQLAQACNAHCLRWRLAHCMLRADCTTITRSLNLISSTFDSRHPNNWRAQLPMMKFRIHHSVFGAVMAAGTSPPYADLNVCLQDSVSTFGNRTQAPNLYLGFHQEQWSA